MVAVEKKSLERQAKKLGLLSKKDEVSPEAAKAEVAALHTEYHDELSLEDEELAGQLIDAEQNWRDANVALTAAKSTAKSQKMRLAGSSRSRRA